KELRREAPEHRDCRVRFGNSPFASVRVTATTDVRSGSPESGRRIRVPADPGVRKLRTPGSPKRRSSMPKVRLDQLVFDRGLAPSRERARALILAAQVTVDGAAIAKAGAQVDSGADVALVVPDHPYVGRGGLKLAHALDAFRIDVTGREALDIGASTGGF